MAFRRHQFGAVIGPVFGSVMIGLGRRLPGVAAALLALVAAAFAWRYLRESRIPRSVGGAASAATGRAAIGHVFSHWHEPASRLIWIYVIASGIVLLAGGLVVTGLAHGYVALAIGFTLMPLGTAFLFPGVTSLLSQAVAGTERGLFMGVQHSFGVQPRRRGGYGS